MTIFEETVEEKHSRKRLKAVHTLKQVLVTTSRSEEGAQTPLEDKIVL